MQRIPLILAGLAAAVILMRITRQKPKILLENIVTERTVKPAAADVTRSIELEKQELQEIVPVQNLSIPGTLEAKYPGLRNLQTKVPAARR